MTRPDYRIVLADTEDLKQKAFKVREEVFVYEQKVDREEEFDQFEGISTHFVVLDRDGSGIGASRWRQTEKGVKLERFAIRQSARGKGIGQQLVEATLSDIRQKLGTGQYLYLHAQLPAVTLYERSGFRKVGDQFEECNILHYKMERTS